MKNGRILREFPYYVALLAGVLIFHRHVLFYSGFVFPWDFRGVHVPLATLIANSIRRGEMPLWDPYTFCGIPLFANIQAALFYPPVLAAEAVGAWLGPELIPRLLAIAVVAQVVFAGICTFVLLKRIGVRAPAAWIGATVYELGCYFAAQAEHMGAMHGASWLPLIWLSIIELRERVRWTWVALLALGLCMPVLAGLPQVALAAFASAVTLAAILALCRLASWRSVAVVLLGCAWALLLAAAQFIPTTQLTENSVAKYMVEWLSSGGGIPPIALVTLVIPNYFHHFDPGNFTGSIDSTFMYLYSSILGFLFALAAAIWKPSKWARVFGLLTVLAAFAMMGDKTPMGRAILVSLPKTIRIGLQQEWSFFVFSLGLAVLAGLGADRFLPNSKLQMLAGVLIMADLILVSSGRSMNVESLAANPGFTMHSADGSAQLAEQLRRLTGETTPPARFDMSPDVPFAWSSMGPLLGIPTANGCDPLAPERIIQVRLSFASGFRWGRCFQVVNPSSPVVGLLNDRFLLSRGEVKAPTLELVAQTAGYKIYENKNWLKRFFFVSRVLPAANLESAARLLHGPGFYPDAQAIVETTEEFPMFDPSARVELLSYSGNEIRLRTESARESFLVITDAYYPGWKASIDGRSAPMYITDVAFRGVRLPAGTHEVRMQFTPRILWISGLLSGLALLLALCAIVQSQRRSTSERIPHR